MICSMQMLVLYTVYESCHESPKNQRDREYVTCLKKYATKQNHKMG